jgi:hypothetical protein
MRGAFRMLWGSGRNVSAESQGAGKQKAEAEGLTDQRRRGAAGL